MPYSAQLSPLDQERFGVRTVKATLVTPDDAARLTGFATAEAASFVIARCPAERLDTAHALEASGYRLMDVLNYYAFDLDRTPIPAAAGGTLVRAMKPGEAAALGDIARRAFHAYSGHYHADERLDPKACDEVYASWAERICAGQGAVDEVLVALVDGAILALAGMRVRSPSEGECSLAAVDPAAQGRGIYRDLAIGCLAWCQRRELRRHWISTILTNLATQRVWTRLGYELQYSLLTFHLWREP